MTSHALDQTISYSTEAEASLLGMILNNNSILDTLNFLKAEHFYGAGNQKIYVMCCDYYNNGKIASPITLRSFADSDSDIGGVRMLVAYVSRTSLKNPVQIGRYIQDLFNRREMVITAQKAIDMVNDQSNDINDVCALLAGKCDAVCSSSKEWEFRNGLEVAESIIESMKNNKKPYETGFTRLDEAMGGGIFAGKMYGFAGRMKHGKTILGGTLSCNLANSGIKHLFICAEMSPEEIHQRNLSRMGGFFPSAFHTEYSKSTDFLEKFSYSLRWAQQNIVYRNAPSLTFDQLKQIIKRAVIYHGIKGFVLDYIQLVGGKESKRSMSEHMDEVAQWIADTCRKYDIFGIVLAQLNQEGNIRGGEGLKLACDQTYAIQRPQIENAGMWLEMLSTRYTPWMDVGNPENCVFELDKYAYFREI